MLPFPCGVPCAAAAFWWAAKACPEPVEGGKRCAAPCDPVPLSCGVLCEHGVENLPEHPLLDLRQLCDGVELLFDA